MIFVPAVVVRNIKNVVESKVRVRLIRIDA